MITMGELIMKKLITILCLTVFLITACLALFGCDSTQQEKTVILQITDVHIRNNAEEDQKAFDTITSLIESTKPDMIVVTGDITSEQDNESAFKTFGNFIEAFKIPWYFVFGNHDAEGNWSKQQLSDYLLTLEYCQYEIGPEMQDAAGGYACQGNYYVNLKDKSGKVYQTLFMLDSNMYAAEGGYDNFHDDQIEWYENTVKQIAEEVNGDPSKVVPSLAFFHIPMQEFTTGYDEARKNKAVLSGRRMEDECPGVNPDDMFETMVELGSTKGVFVGHDHMNNYSVEYQGIRLTYANSCDHNIYLVPKKGGCLIEVYADGSFTTQSIYRSIGSSEFTFEEKI